MALQVTRYKNKDVSIFLPVIFNHKLVTAAECHSIMQQLSSKGTACMMMHCCQHDRGWYAGLSFAILAASCSVYGVLLSAVTNRLA